MEQDNNTYETLDSGNADSDIAPVSVKETVSAVPQNTADTLSLAELNEALGKNYKDKDSALKSFKDTFSFVGKKVEPKIDPNQFISREQYESDMFYSKNPELNSPEIREMIDAMAKAQGIKPQDVVNKDSFKAVFSKVKGYDESQSMKSVLESNPRLSSSRDSLTQAREEASKGNTAKAEELAVKAVMDAYAK